jgi:hypothetical protein
MTTTTERVPAHTAGHVNAEIDRQTEANVGRFIAEGPAAIDRRLKELDREWDIERTLEANASTVSLIGLALGAFVNAWFFVVPALVAGFLLLHAVQGWCSPVPILRRLGFRTEREIDHERYALKALRGDFEGLAGETGPEAIFRALTAARS